MPRNKMHIFKVFHLYIILYLLLLFIYDLFKDSVSNSDYVTSNGGMISE
jgi:hypothetical protein